MERVNSIFDFFGNDDFVKANKEKVFSIEEEVAIIIHNKTQPLEIKFQALERRKSMLPDELARDVEQWIEYKRNVLSYVQNINREDIVFVIRFDGNVANEKVFRTYKQAMENSMCCFGLNIEKVNSAGEKIWGTVGSVDVDEDGNVIENYGTETKRQVVSTENCKVIWDYLYRSVSEAGGNKNAAAQDGLLPGAGAEEDAVELRVDVFHGDVLAHVDAALDGDAHLLDGTHHFVHDVLGQTVVRHAVTHDAAGLFLTLKDGDAVAGLAQIVGSGEAAGAGADDGDLLAGLLLGHGVELIQVLHDVVAHAALDAVDVHGIAVFTLVAGVLAGMGADAGGDHGKGVGLQHDLRSGVPVALADLRHVGGDVGAGGALTGAGAPCKKSDEGYNNHWNTKPSNHHCHVVQCK